MQVLARDTAMMAHLVTGSDSTYSPVMATLSNIGINCYVGADLDVVESADLVVYSLAVPESDIEFSYALSHGIRLLDRGEYLSLISTFSSETIAIAGTHGKSTTTAILGSIMREAGASYTLHVGANTRALQPFSPGSQYFVTEACEYKESFLHLSPHIGAVTSVDFDHPDVYASIEDIREAFLSFVHSADIAIVHDGVDLDGGVTYGYLPTSTYRITNAVATRDGYTFDVNRGVHIAHIVSPLHGEYNVHNATLAYAIADIIGIDEASILRGIANFDGISRRFEDVGFTRRGARVISDYAHHPEEIERVIATAHECTHGRVIVVFEPHTYSRTASLIDAFASCFYWADSLLLLPTFGAREQPCQGMDTFDLITHLKANQEYPLYFSTYKSCARYLLATASASDTILVLGAGTIHDLATMLVGESRSLISN